MIPKGVADGQVMRLRGLGQDAHGGEPGDLRLTIRIAPHGRFTVEGANLRHRGCRSAIEEAILGAKVRVPTLTGAVEMGNSPDDELGAHLPAARQGPAREGRPGRPADTVDVRLPEAADDALLDFARRRKAARAV